MRGAGCASLRRRLPSRHLLSRCHAPHSASCNHRPVGKKRTRWDRGDLGIRRGHRQTGCPDSSPRNRTRDGRPLLPGGRAGGRDGRRSASLLIYGEDDIEVAKSIASPSLISDDLAFERWQAMFDHSATLDQLGLLREIDLSIVPERLRQQSDYNQDWNMRTLIMMARAKMLQLESQSPQRFAELEAQAGGAFDSASEEDWADYFQHVVVHLSLLNHREKGEFKRAIAAERSRALGALNTSQKLLHQLLSGRKSSRYCSIGYTGSRARTHDHCFKSLWRMSGGSCSW